MNIKNIGYVLFLLFSTVQTLSNCAQQKKISYSIPADIPPENERVLRNVLEKGKILYKNNCSSCHGIFSQGKENVPNFSKEQLDNYTTRFVLSDEKNHGIAHSLSQEELKSILIFLNLVKRNL